MDGINGIEAGKCLRNNNKNIVLFIITSYMGYLDDAMDEGVFRYINKPLERPVIMQVYIRHYYYVARVRARKSILNIRVIM